MAELDQLPLTRDIDGQLQLAGTGPVALQTDYRHILGTGGQGVVFKGVLTNISDGSLAAEVALKMHKHVEDPRGSLRREAEMHAKAWAQLDHVLKPFGFLAAHEATDTPAILVLEIGVTFREFLVKAGPPPIRHLRWARAIARVTDQLLRFIVAGDAVNLMHKDIKLENVFVSNSHDLELAGLAMGDFGGAQNGIAMAGGQVMYHTGVYTWNHTSPRMASAVYGRMSQQGTPTEQIELDRQLIFYNDLFGWARVAFQALADRSPPDILYGPSAEDYAAVPNIGYGDVLDAISYLLRLSLDVLTAGQVDEEADSDFIKNLQWYDDLPHVLGGNYT